MFGPGRPDEHQLAGHKGGIFKIEGGMLRKMVKEPEARFYTTLQERKLPEEYYQWIPKLYGLEIVNGTRFVVMEDLTNNLGDHPSLLDIKIGRTSVDPRASKAKQQHMHQRDLETTTASVGLRLSGYKVYNIVTQEYYHISKAACRNYSTRDQIKESFLRYFHNGVRMRTDVIQYFLKRLNHLYQVRSTHPCFRLISGSLLFIYDGSSETVKANVKMIDFAHVLEFEDGKGNDDDYLFGIRSLIEIFTEILQTCESS